MFWLCCWDNHVLCQSKQWLQHLSHDFRSPFCPIPLFSLSLPLGCIHQPGAQDPGTDVRWIQLHLQHWWLLAVWPWADDLIFPASVSSSIKWRIIFALVSPHTPLFELWLSTSQKQLNGGKSVLSHSFGGYRSTRRQGGSNVRHLVTWWAGSRAWKPNPKRVSWISFSRPALSKPLPLTKPQFQRFCNLSSWLVPIVWTRHSISIEAIALIHVIMLLRGLNEIIWIKLFARWLAMANTQHRLPAVIVTNIVIGLGRCCLLPYLLFSSLSPNTW